MLGKPVKSAERALAVFEYFADEQRSLTVTDVSAGMKMPLSSASALLKSFVHLGYLDYNAVKRTYYPTLRITLLGTWLSRRHTAIGRIPALLSNLVETTGESALIATRNGIHVQYVMVQVGPDPLRLDVRSGQLKPLVCTASGWSLLMNVSDAEIGKIIRRTQVEAETPHWRQTAAEANEQIALARKQGYAQSRGQATEWASAISVPIPAISHAPFALSVGGPIERVEKKKTLILDAIDTLLNEIKAEPEDPLWQQISGPAGVPPAILS